MKFQNSKLKKQNRRAAFCFLSFVLLTACGVSVPNLETPACIESGDAVKRFYSYHLDAGAALTPETIAMREKYLTPELYGKLQSGGTDADPFTHSAEIPRGFRLGECKSPMPDETSVKVFLFWRNGEDNRQRTIVVETVKRNENWLINNISEE